MNSTFTFQLSPEANEFFSEYMSVIDVWLEIDTDCLWARSFLIVDPDDAFGNWMCDYEKGTFSYQAPHPDLPEFTVFRISHKE